MSEKCWRCKQKVDELENVGINVVNEKRDWTWYTRFLCIKCLSEFGAFKKRRKLKKTKAKTSEKNENKINK